jgi:hypothetical protein
MNQNSSKFVIAVILISLIIMFSSCATKSTADEESPLLSLLEMRPIPTLTPEEVVVIQLTAFKENNIEDQGIALAYRFASPRNKQITGTVENFASQIRRDPYASILSNVEFQLGPVDRRGELAMVTVRIDQTEEISTGYIFVLTRQKGGEFDNCWMTDGVLQINMGNLSAFDPIATIDT